MRDPGIFKKLVSRRLGNTFFFTHLLPLPIHLGAVFFNRVSPMIGRAKNPLLHRHVNRLPPTVRITPNYFPLSSVDFAHKRLQSSRKPGRQLIARITQMSRGLLHRRPLAKRERSQGRRVPFDAVALHYRRYSGIPRSKVNQEWQAVHSRFRAPAIK